MPCFGFRSSGRDGENRPRLDGFGKIFDAEVTWSMLGSHPEERRGMPLLRSSGLRG